ncbi:MAG: hypothetical protein GY785_02410 [Gammaproteobacteria bacterium]|nr:hypothetical protein [Gammaproteobacteria bacterium]
MEQILIRPEIQSAVAPFVIALLVFFGLRKISAQAWLWAVFAAFLASVLLINGVTVTPLTGTRKIILLVLISFLAAALLPRLLPRANLQRAVAACAAVLALLWVFWAVLARMEAGAIALFVAGSIGLALWLLFHFDRLVHNDARLHAAGFSLLLGVGLSATAAASALLGQLALALSAASGGTFLAWVLFANKARAEAAQPSITTLPYVLAPLLLGLAAVIFARLPWYALLALAAIPLAVSLLPLKPDSRFISALLSSLPGLVIAIAVGFWVWQSGSPDSGY